jgi:hypothetical protein
MRLRLFIWMVGIMPIDAVFLSVQNSDKNHLELRYSLRSLEKHCSDVGSVFLIGFQPKWCFNLINIPKNDPHQNNKEANIIDKVLLCCNNPKISDPFLLISDDHYISQNVKASEFGFYHKGNIVVSPSYHEYYRKMYKNTLGLLRKKDLPILNYNVHVPIPVYKKMFVESFKKVDYTSSYVLFKSWYINNWKGFDKGIKISDCKLKSSEKRGLQDLLKLVANRPAFSTTNSMPMNVRGLLEYLYPDKSLYERSGL